MTRLRQDRDTAEARSWHDWGKIVTQLRQDRDTAETRSWHSWGKMAFKNLSSIEKETCPNGQVSFIMSCKRDYYSSTAACAAANGNWLSAHYGESGKRLGNIMSMNCTFCTRFPQNIRPFLPLRLLFDILIVKRYCWNTDCITTFQHVLQTLFAKLMISSDFTFILHVFLAERVWF